MVSGSLNNVVFVRFASYSLKKHTCPQQYTIRCLTSHCVLLSRKKVLIRLAGTLSHQRYILNYD